MLKAEIKAKKKRGPTALHTTGFKPFPPKKSPLSSPRKAAGKKKDSGRRDKGLKPLASRTRQDKGLKPARLGSDQWREKLAGCTVLEGDCRKLIKQIPEGSVDLIIADPPYGKDYQSHRKPKGQRLDPMMGDRTPGDATELLGKMAYEIARVLRPDGHLYIFCTPMQMANVLGALVQFPHEATLVYVTGRGMGDNTNQRYVSGWQAILFFHNGSKVGGRKLNGHPSDVIWVGRTVKPHMVHPAQKDVYGISVLVEASSQPGEVVLDFTAGSGTTGVACRMCPDEARKVILMEIDPEHAKVCRERMRIYGKVETELPKTKSQEAKKPK